MPGNFLDNIENSPAFRTGKRGLFSIIFSRTVVILLALLLQIVLLFFLLSPFFEYVSVLVGGVAILTTGMLLYILNTDANPTVKLSWCIIIAALPLFGTILYFWLRFDIGSRVGQHLVQRSLNGSAAVFPDPKAKLEQLRSKDQGLYNLAHYLSTNGGHTVYTNTKVTYFPLGEDKFREMLVQLEKAEKFIFMEYFTIGPSTMWDTILEILARKAKAGVEVRVMYDGTCAVACFPYGYPRELEKLGIQCRMFSPLLPFISTHYNNRDHRKILVIDGKVAFTGGINIQDRYINRKQVYGHWKDTAIMLEGEGAQGFTRMFLQMWNTLEKEPVFEPYLNPVDGPPAEGCVIPYGDSPLDKENVGEMVYLNMLNQARDYCWIMTPYLILDNEMVTALRFAAKRGVDVRLILPHIPDKKYAFCLAQSHYRELLEAGVRIYEYTPGFVHAKVFLSDDRDAVVGTINLDYRSLYLHFECAAYLYKVPALADIKTDFTSTMKMSQEITLEDAKKLPLFTKIAGKLLKVVAPLM